MRLNEPVTQREVSFDPEEVLISKTDLRGVMTYANAAFIQVSGYGLGELLGQPHNLLRHPDMPQEPFRDLWATIQAGRPWTGIIKNRCKNGDHYWVFADVTPIRESGRVVGYMSTRSRPDPKDREEAQARYARLAKGEAAGPGLAERLRGVALATRFRMLFLVQVLGGLGCLVYAGLTRELDVLLAGLLWLATAALVQVESGRMVRHLGSLTQAMESCDLRVQLPVTGALELRSMAHAFNVLNGRFRRVIRDLARVSRAMVSQNATLSSATEELSMSLRSMAENSRSQGAASEVMASGVTQLAASVSQIATSARLVEQQASESDLTAAEEERAGDDLSTAMQGIRESTTQMGKAVTVIGEIARQTNLLSLNAAIEAAKAGHQGAGFAVVAEEVRKLAERSASSAKEIATFIHAAQKAVDEGESTVATTVQLLKQIRASLELFAQQTRHISSATSEQSRAGAEVAKRVDQSVQEATVTASATAQMAATTHEVARTASDLAQVAERLQGMVQRFTL